MRLLGVELRRLRLRRLVLMLSVLGVLAAGFLVLIAQTGAQPVTEEDRAWAEQAYADAVANWEEHGEEQVAQCEEDEAADAERSGQPVDFGCDEMGPQREWFLPHEPTLAEYLTGTVSMAMAVMALVGLLIGGTAVAAEFSSGSMGTLLTFEPRRRRVYAAKVAAVGLGTIPLSILMAAIIGGGTWAVFALRDMDAAAPAELVWTGVRFLALLPAAAVAGAVLGFLVRSIGAVLGVAAGYAVTIEGILRAAVPSALPWIPSQNALSWTNYGATYYTQNCTREAGGIVCEQIEQTVSFGWSAGYLLVLGTVLILLTGWTFSRRDVN